MRNLKSGYRPRIKNFKGNYVTVVPEIEVFELDETYKGLLLGSDGLWDL